MRRALIPYLTAAALTASAALAPALADEGGVSFWLPGNFGSLAAAPGTPGWSWATIYYHGEAAAAANAQFPRGGRTDVGISGRGDLAFFGPTYTFATPVLGGQAAISILGAAGRNEASAALSLTGPLGNTIALSRTQELTSLGDVIPSATLKWNFGTSNLMVYGMGDVPIGDYDPARLANLGIGHAAVDFGGGYTYFDPKSGNEFSWVAGLTYNFKNPDTQYRNGADFHIDWGVSHFFDSKLQLGLVGYYFQQVSDDFGAPASLDGFRSRVAGIGAQVGYIFPMGDKLQGYVNLKGYWEFAAQNRAAGLNTWLTFAISPAAPEPTRPSRSCENRYDPMPRRSSEASAVFYRVIRGDWMIVRAKPPHDRPLGLQDRLCQIARPLKVTKHALRIDARTKPPRGTLLGANAAALPPSSSAPSRSTPPPISEGRRGSLSRVALERDSRPQSPVRTLRSSPRLRLHPCHPPLVSLQATTVPISS